MFIVWADKGARELGRWAVDRCARLKRRELLVSIRWQTRRPYRSRRPDIDPNRAADSAAKIMDRSAARAERPRREPTFRRSGGKAIQSRQDETDVLSRQ